MTAAAHPAFAGRRMIIAAFIMGFCSGPGQSFSFSVFQPYLLESFEMTRGTFAGIYAAGSLLSALLAALAGRLTDRIGIRRTLLLTAIVMAAACFGMVVSRDLVSLSVSLAVLRSLGQGTLTLLASLLVMQWYARRRGGAMSLAGLGVSLSGALLPPLSFAAISAVGWRATYGWIGLAELVVLTAVAILLVKNRPEDLGQSPDGDSPVAPPPRTIDRRVFRSSRFWILALSLASSPFVVTALVFQQSSLFEDQGIGRSTAAAMLTVVAASAAAATLATGRLVDLFGVRKVLRGLIGCQILVLLIAHGLAVGPAVVWIYSILLGILAGGSGVMGGVTWARFYGREGLGRVQGSAGTVILTAAAIAPLPLGFLRDLTGSHAAGLTVCLAVPIAGLLLLCRDLKPAE